jgi:hypothetical protein
MNIKSILIKEETHLEVGLERDKHTLGGLQKDASYYARLSVGSGPRWASHRLDARGRLAETLERVELLLAKMASDTQRLGVIKGLLKKCSASEGVPLVDRGYPLAGARTLDLTGRSVVHIMSKNKMLH